MMLGAIIGDVVGSKYEANPVKTKEIDLFYPSSRYTDDTVLTLAIASAIIQKKDYGVSLKKFGLAFPHAGYGGGFKAWLYSDNYEAYNSFGNGSAMRVSPVAWAFNNENDALIEAERSAICTHNHPEGIKGAQAVALSIFMAKNGSSKDEIQKDISRVFGYNLDRKLEDIRPEYSFDVTCHGSVPEAILCFLESDDFEDAIKNAISLGGDADTQAAIAGSIAEAFYGDISENLIYHVLFKLPKPMLGIIREFSVKFMDSKYIDIIDNLMNLMRYSGYKKPDVTDNPFEHSFIERRNKDSNDDRFRFDIEILDNRDDIRILHLVGRLTLEDFHSLEQELSSMYQSGILKIVIDCKQLYPIDSAGTGLYIFLLLHNISIANNGCLVFASFPDRTFEVLHRWGWPLNYRKSLKESIDF